MGNFQTFPNSEFDFAAKKQVAFQKAKEAYQKIIEGETKATLDQLQKLENQRQKILHQLKNARERVDSKSEIILN